MRDYLMTHAWARRTYIVVAAVPALLWHIATDVVPELWAEIKTNW